MSKNRSRVHPTRHTAYRPKRRTRHKESIPRIPPRKLTHPLQIHHLTNRHSPQRQQILVQHPPLFTRPHLESRLIARHRSEIAIVQPIQHRVFLLETSPDGAFAGCESCVLLVATLVVVLSPAGAEEEDVPDLDVAALGRRANVETLPAAAEEEVGVADFVRRGRVVGDGVGLGVAAVVEEDATAAEAMLAPVVNRTFIRAGKVAGLGVVVERRGRLVRDMAESVPLCA